MDELVWLQGHAPVMGLQVLVAAVAGSMVGYERARNEAAAGMKTCMLICVGATAYTHVGVTLFDRLHEGDPARVASQIVSGIGFLGAGAILRGNEGVTGLTTAATIWFLGAVGIIIGSGYPLSGGALTVVVLLMMSATRAVEGWLLPRRANNPPREGGES